MCGHLVPPSFANMGLEMVRRSCCSLVSLQRGVLPRKRRVHCANGAPTVSVGTACSHFSSSSVGGLSVDVFSIFSSPGAPHWWLRIAYKR